MILIEIGAGDPISSATFSILYSSDSDSTLKDKIPLLIPCSISFFVLPTPEKITFLGSAPIDRTLLSSPPETISNPHPLFLMILSIDKLLSDLTAKQARLSLFVNEFTYALAFS